MTVLSSRIPFRLALLAMAAGLAGCSALDNFLGGDKVDYRSVSKSPTKNLEVPPDLSQLARDSRYQLPGGVVSAAAVANPAALPTGTPAVAPSAIGGMRIERDGSTRWLVVPAAPEQIWPQVRAFWLERGFTIARESAETGVIETDWAENRAKLPQDIIRNAIGRVFDNLYDTGERDRFRTRIERTANGSEIFISHRGMVEQLIGERKDSTMWTQRPADPQLEAEFLSRLMVRLGTREETARTAVAAAVSAPAAAPRARLLAAGGTTLEVDEPFDRAWRRLGLALDRSGYTVEDRDRAAGLYFVRYVDPKEAGKEDPNIFQRLFGRTSTGGPQRYRVVVKAAGDKTSVSVLNSAGAQDNSENAKRIAAQLVGDLK